MGRRMVSMNSIIYRDAAPDLPIERIVYQDMVRTLRMDATKYIPPRVDSSYALESNAVFVRAAREAGIQSLIVEGPWPENETPVRPEGELRRNFLFFDQPRFGGAKPVLDAYFDACKSVFENTRGENHLDTLTYRVSGDCLEYTLQGRLESTESLRLLQPATKEFFRKLRHDVGTIRSINGIRPVL